MDNEEILKAIRHIEGRLESLEELAANIEHIVASTARSEARRVCEIELGKLREEIDLD